MGIVIKVQVNVEFLNKIINRKDLIPSVSKARNHGKLLLVDKNSCIASAGDLMDSTEDLFPVDLYRVVPSSEIGVEHFNSPSNN